ncbi:nucleoside diphosphate kinase 7 [Nasonia vitripennis]|uniref:DM10 domain-containing protein n=1 Tax=Nasonia vitripennis TaxID=7425 RepID=A0A7M7GFU5_NASVI|nr:nucleoside diphosphate kinase 7 [Nasonia vitripennis]
MSTDSDRYIFEAEWYDKVAYTLRKFYLYYFPSDNSVELFDLKTRKTFLRRTKCEGVEAKDFYVGAIVTIFSRSIKIINFADQATKDKLSYQIIRAFIIVKSDAVDKLSDILNHVNNHDFHISNIKLAKINHEDAIQIFKSTIGKSPDIVESMTSGPVIALELLSKDGSSKWCKLSAAFRKSALLDGVYIPDNKDDILPYFFPSEKNKSKIKNSAKLQHCTCCIIKPHAVQSRLIAPIINDIRKANFVISAIQQFHIDPVNAEEFLEVYKGVLPDYAAMVSELQSGPCIVMEITHKDENFDVVNEFRKLCGPMDPKMAKQLHPNTLRAKYGKTRIQNAVHCSDLPEDGLLEVEYFFKILDN